MWEKNGRVERVETPFYGIIYYFMAAEENSDDEQY